MENTTKEIKTMNELRSAASLAYGYLLGVCNASTPADVAEYGTKLKELVVEIVKYKVNEVDKNE